MKQYLFNLLVALDQLLNTVRGGSPDETLSSAAYRTEVKGRILGCVSRPLIDFIFLPWEKNHCHGAYLSELSDRQLPKEFQEG